MEFWKLGAIYFCTVKTFSSFQKLGAGSGGQSNNFFLSKGVYGIDRLSKTGYTVHAQQLVISTISAKIVQIDTVQLRAASNKPIDPWSNHAKLIPGGGLGGPPHPAKMRTLDQSPRKSYIFVKFDCSKYLKNSGLILQLESRIFWAAARAPSGTNKPKILILDQIMQNHINCKPRPRE